MNKNQKIILAIFVPVILFFIVLLIANSVGVEVTTHITGKPKILGGPGGPIGSYRTYTHDLFYWGKTWYVWMLYLTFCCIFEYKLFADKKAVKK